MTRPREIRGFGWIPDVPDQRDHLYAAPPQYLKALPLSTDLRAKCPPVYDQGALGSCTANAIAAAVEFDRMTQKLSDFVPSRLFIYYNERAIEGTVPIDAGAMLRDGIKPVASDGVCPAPERRYDIAKFTHKPSQTCYADATLNPAVSYQSTLQELSQRNGRLAGGYPFSCGSSVYDSFRSGAVRNTGHAPMTDWGKRPR